MLMDWCRKMPYALTHAAWCDMLCAAISCHPSLFEIVSVENLSDNLAVLSKPLSRCPSHSAGMLSPIYTEPAGWMVTDGRLAHVALSAASVLCLQVSTSLSPLFYRFRIALNSIIDLVTWHCFAAGCWIMFMVSRACGQIWN